MAETGKKFDVVVMEAVEENGLMSQRLFDDVVLIRWVLSFFLSLYFHLKSNTDICWKGVLKLLGHVRNNFSFTPGPTRGGLGPRVMTCRVWMVDSMQLRFDWLLLLNISSNKLGITSTTINTLLFILKQTGFKSLVVDVGVSVVHQREFPYTFASVK